MSALTSRCNSCGAEIKWLLTKTGKKIPVNVPKFEIIDGKPINEIANEAVVTAVEFNPSYMISHFATCPNANTHRKPREKSA